MHVEKGQGGRKEKDGWINCVHCCVGFHDASEGDSRYIPKELLRGQFSTAADIFSLGISLLELACDLELPSEGEGWHRLREGQLPLPFIKGNYNYSRLLVVITGVVEGNIFYDYTLNNQIDISCAWSNVLLIWGVA